MIISITKPLFAWDSLEDSPALRTIRECIRVIPDGGLLASLDNRRGNGRDDYPVRVLWGVLLIAIITRQQTIEACLGELRRNPSLRLIMGIESEKGVPNKWNMSRFLNVLGTEPHLSLLVKVFDDMASMLGSSVPDMGRNLAGDATGLLARLAKAEKGKKRRKMGHDLPLAAGARKEYTDEAGKVTHVFEWFGYKLHLMVDRKHEVALGYRITSATAADNETLPEVLEKAESNLPKGRIRTLAYDKAADDENIHEVLKDAKIRPVIQNRSMWKDDLERMLPGHDGKSNVVYDEAGTIYCYDKVSEPPVRRRMTYMGYEEDRGALKYRCPARYGGWRCPSDRKCNGDSSFGKTLRVKCGIDLRRFPPIPRATKEFERLYKERTSVERVNARLKVFWGADDGNIAGAKRFHAYMGAVMVVHLAFATLLAKAPRKDEGKGRSALGKMRLSEIAKALEAKIKT